MQSRVAILDAGGQYIDLVRKAVERQGIPTDILPLNTPLDRIEKTYGAIIISGSPASSQAEAAPQPENSVWTTNLPLLGICYGMQAMVVAHGGSVARNAIREDGRVTTRLEINHPIFQGLKAEFRGLFTHGDFVQTIPQGFQVIGSHPLANGTVAYSAIAKGKMIGLQFHPEVFDDTPGGYQIFQNFLVHIAGLTPDKNFRTKRMQQLVSDKQAAIATQVGNRHVIAFVSGGVDSSVAAVLAAGVIPAERLHAFYIDSGFMRVEDDHVIASLKSAGLRVKKVRALKQFEQGTITVDGTSYGPLRSTTDPEQKRKIIGSVFIAIQNALVTSLKLSEALLLQGTNAADRIESGHSSGDSHTMTIKTHHNQVKEVQKLKAKGLVLEPLDDLFKDEVRAVGRQLGLPDELVERQPFPGPGLAIRIMATDGAEVAQQPGTQQLAIQKFLDEKSFKIQAQLLPIRSVGVGGDERSHLSVVAIENANLDADTLASLGAELPAHFHSTVNRAIYALTPGSLAAYSVTPTLLTSSVRTQLRQADAIVFEEMRRTKLLSAIQQFPVILLPLSFTAKKQRSIVLRPVTTTTFMTVQAMLPVRDLPATFFKTITQRILQEVPSISQVFLDLTNKPPATTEWE